MIPSEPSTSSTDDDAGSDFGGGSEVVVSAQLPLTSWHSESAIPTMVQRVGNVGEFAWDEFFSAQLQNKHTRIAYLGAVRRFLAWIEPYEPNLVRVTPGLIGRYFSELSVSLPSKKLHLAAIRGLFDVLVQRHIVVINPASSVRTERFSSLEGKTPEISIEQARKLLNSISINSVVDLRDKAVLGTLIYTAARAGAVAKLRLGDLMDEGSQFALQFREKRGLHRHIPVRHDLQELLLAYVTASTTHTSPKDLPMFRTAIGRKYLLSDNAMTGIDICRMMKRRLKAAQLPTNASPHSFRSCAATDLLLQGVPLEDVQYLLGHSDVRVTRLYDRRQRRVTRNIVERISV